MPRALLCVFKPERRLCQYEERTLLRDGCAARHTVWSARFDGKPVALKE